MIGILYLVLLGLIALNVPDSLLDAFKNIKDSLDTSTSNVNKGINDTYSTFEATTLKDQHDRAESIYKRAKQASAVAKALNDYVQSLRDSLVAEGGGINPSINDVGGRDNLDISPHEMIANKKGEILKQKINDTRAQLLALLKDDKERAGVNFSLNTDEPQQTGGNVHKTWEEAYFGDGIPLGATLTTLAKIQTDNKNAENEVVKKILSEAQKAQVNLDKFAAVATAPTSYVLLGAPYTANVFLTAYDSKLSPNISVNGAPIPVDAGMGKYTGSTSSEGPHTWKAIVSFKDNDGKIQSYETPEQSYMVARPSAVVSPTKMNVLYIGLPNPVAISAPGIAKSDLRVSMTGGSISGSGDSWVATVSSIGTATINVSGEITKGKVSFLGSSVFRVKRIPDPVAEFAGTSGGSQNTATIQGQNYIFATLKDFEFDTKFNIKSYKLTILKPKQDAITINGYGNTLSSDVKEKLKSVSAGTRIVFDDIYAVGPDKTERLLNSITIKAN
jgi:gliding motility-associated protein GldM